MTTLLVDNTSMIAAPTLAVSRRRVRAGGFSLIEVLLAIFILGVGVISIAALFPAGIAQQRASVDDIIAPTVANNAISLLRTKLRPDDFGTFEQFAEKAPRTTITGDFIWIRPAFIFADDPATPNLDERGAINIFSRGNYDATEFDGGYAASSPSLVGIPYNRGIYDIPSAPGGAPRIIISQTERYYPAISQIGSADVARPQYVWDCMFRKFQGKVYVAIFVYRVTQPGGGNAAYVVAPNISNPNLPPVPIALDLTQAAIQSTSCANGPWHPGGIDKNASTLLDNTVIRGVPGGVAYNPDDGSMSWQEPRQWILDQNNNVHRVLGVSREDDNLINPIDVELVRAAPGMAPIGVNYIGAGANPDVVSDIWYMPVALRDVDGNLQTVTPVYCTVKEL